MDSSNVDIRKAIESGEDIAHLFYAEGNGGGEIEDLRNAVYRLAAGLSGVLQLLIANKVLAVEEGVRIVQEAQAEKIGGPRSAQRRAGDERPCPPAGDDGT